MTRFFSLLTGLAIIAAAAATTSTAHADVVWTAGAPGGTSGGSLDFTPPADVAGNITTIFDTGVASNDIYGTGGTATGDYTVSAWINPDVLTEMWFLGTQNEALHVGIRDNDALRVGHWGADSSGTTALAVGTWTHATFTYDADGGTGGTGLQSVFFNGTADGSSDNGAPNNTNGNLVIGGRIRNATEGNVPGGGLNRQPWDGQIDDVAIFDFALTAAQVADLASGAQGAVALGAAAYYDFEDDQFGTTAAVQGSLGGSLAGVTANVVPEPTSLALLGFGAIGMLVRRKRS